MTVLETIQRSAEFLAGKGVDSPRLQAELLLAHTLKTERVQLYLGFERVLTPAEIELMRGLVRRRGRREPLQQITGSSLLLRAGNRGGPPGVGAASGNGAAGRGGLAIPAGLVRQGQRAAPAPTALEFGVGSGCLAIALAVQCPQARVYGVEVSAEALEVARQNASRHGVADRLELWLGDGFGAVPAGLRADLVVSNPPYIPSAELDSLAPEVRDHEPRLALDGGPDGLQYVPAAGGRGRAFPGAGGTADGGIGRRPGGGPAPDPPLAKLDCRGGPGGLYFTTQDSGGAPELSVHGHQGLLRRPARTSRRADE